MKVTLRVNLIGERYQVLLENIDIGKWHFIIIYYVQCAFVSDALLKYFVIWSEIQNCIVTALFKLTTRNSVLSTFSFPSVSNILKAIRKPVCGSVKIVQKIVMEFCSKINY